MKYLLNHCCSVKSRILFRFLISIIPNSEYWNYCLSVKIYNKYSSEKRKEEKKHQFYFLLKFESVAVHQSQYQRNTFKTKKIYWLNNVVQNSMRRYFVILTFEWITKIFRERIDLLEYLTHFSMFRNIQ